MADGVERTMARKRATHYNNTNSIISISMLITSICSVFCLSFLWPQIYTVEVFNSRLIFELILDIEDYFTCSGDYVDFVIDEPGPDSSMYSLYVFNITNAADVFQRGFKPDVVETGPYGFRMHTYKYDIAFEEGDSLTVSFKEYTLLKEITDRDLCEEMYFRMDRALLEDEPCLDATCKCKDLDDRVIIVNALLLKLLWEDTPHLLLAHYAVDVFENVKNLLDEPFTEAVKAHLVSDALKEVYLFRVNMQIGAMLNTAVESLTQNATLEEVGTSTAAVPSCGLEIYGLTGCPFRPGVIRSNIIATYPRASLNASFYPTMTQMLNVSNDYSFLNLKIGLPRFIGLIWATRTAAFNGGAGYTMVTDQELFNYAEEMADQYAVDYFGVGSVDLLSSDMRLGARRMVDGLVTYLYIDWVFQQSVVFRRLQSLASQEFINTFEPVPCAPTGEECVWQWGYMRENHGNTQPISAGLSFSLIDTGSEVNTNPNNFYKDVNAPPTYNNFLYCTEVLNYNRSLHISCTDLVLTKDDALINRPAGLWGVDFGVSAVNVSDLRHVYQLQSDEIKERYFYFSCNMSFLQQSVYRTETEFHDNFVVRFLNKNQDPLLNHTFVVGNWIEMGLAQWGGGFITEAIVGVRTINQVVRDGMWQFGPDNLYEKLIEFSSWSLRQGFPNLWITSVDEARTLLYSLARRDSIGVELRRNIMFRGSTLIGDGINFDNFVGELGEVAYTPEANLGDFSCFDDENGPACTLLDVFVNSSAANCEFIQGLYDECLDQFNFQNNRWINSENCVTFQTSITSSTDGIPCDRNLVFGNPHPYLKSRGNVVYAMMLSYAIEIVLLEGLWCSAALGCDFNRGGMFTTTTVRKVLFEGYSEPSVLKYLNLKYAENEIGFECANAPFDQCGIKSYVCDEGGVVMTLPQGQRKLLLHGNTSRDEYFVPYFVANQRTGELIWPFSMDETVASEASTLLSNASFITTHGTANIDVISSNETYVAVNNPFYATYPDWYSENDSARDFNQFFQCTKRTLGGMPGFYPSCVDTLYTGRDEVKKAMSLKLFHGNETVLHFTDGGPGAVAVNDDGVNEDTGISVLGGSTTYRQLPMYLWSGFKTYPYEYLGRVVGDDHFTLSEPLVFHKQHSMMFKLSQTDLVFDFEREVTAQYPVPVVVLEEGATTPYTLPTRRFTEDTVTWDRLRSLGTPNDSLGMPFRIPHGMASLERLAGFPVFIGTPHFYGNEEWGGSEYTLLTGLNPQKLAQRTFLDYDPITGRSIRSAVRQQVNIRVEASPMFPNVFSSLARCTAPTKAFVGGTGYGCFTYIPLLWYEEADAVSTEDFVRRNSQFYTRPDRALALQTAGVVIGILFFLFGSCLYINESYHRKRFNARVYID